MKNKLLLIVIPCALICSFAAILIAGTSELRLFVEKSHKVRANFLIIESWLSEFAIEKAKGEINGQQYEYIVTTGIRSSDLDFCMVAMNGYLIFYPKQFIKSIPSGENASHQFGIIAHSKMGGIYDAHFNVYVNDSLTADFSAGEKPAEYRFAWKAPLAGIDSVMVQFTNDYVDSKGDRNLYVREIIIDDLVIPYQFNSVFDPGSIGGTDRIVNNYFSEPELLRNRLIKTGIDPLNVIAVTGKRTRINRTLESALAFRKWIKSQGINPEGVNIVTMETHAKRTWTTYRAILNNSIDIGMIPIPDSAGRPAEKPGLLNRLTEALDLFYYKIILIPYQLIK
ncbi:MAG: carbohydrate-binding domain-containing protein [Bacteroidales bacterium]